MQEAQYLYSMTKGVKEHIGAGALILKIEEKVTGRDLSHIEDEVHSIRSTLSGRYPETAKPTHIALIAASMALFGDHDYCGNVISALCGTLTILVIFYLGKRIGGTAVGLTSAFLLAVSPLHLIYSRETLAEADSIFFFYCAILLWYIAREEGARRRLALFSAGAAAGMSLTCNDRWIIIPFILFFLEVASLREVRARRLAAFATDCALLAMGFVIPLLLWESVYVVLKYGLGLLPRDYYDQFLVRTTFHTGFSVGYGRIVPFFLIFARFEGVNVTLLLLAGIVLLCLRRSRADIVLLIVFLFPFALFTFRPHHFLRIFSLTIPCIYLVAASFVCGVREAAVARGIISRASALGIAMALTAVAAAPNLDRDARVIQWRSFHREATDFLTKRGARYYSTDAELSKYYSAAATVGRPLWGEGAAVDRADVRSFPYLLADKQRFYETTFGPSPSEWVQKVHVACPAVYEVRENLDMLFFQQFAFEHNMDYGETSAFLEKLNIPEAAMLRVYRLSDCL